MTTSQTPAKDPEETLETATDSVSANDAGANPLQAEIDRLKDENAKLRDQWVRAVAETENVRKRSQREQEETARYATSGFAHDMVSVLENLKRASESIPAGARDSHELLKIVGEGVDLTLQELLNIFEKYGIRRIDPINQKFDHNLHQAVAQLERDDVPSGTVIHVVQAGYTIHDRLLKPAMVAVSKSSEAPKKVDETA
jgi:molecular chaperone GrpE